jgi:hypothetical protein
MQHNEMHEMERTHILQRPSRLPSVDLGLPIDDCEQ